MVPWRERHLPGPHHTLVPRWHHDPRWRLAVSVAIGGIGVWLALLFRGWSYALLVGWVIIACLYCLITAAAVWRMSPQETASHALAESPGNLAVHVMLLGAAGISLIGVIALLAQPQSSPVESALITLLVVVGSWSTIATIYTLRYARKYYEDGGGVSFNQDVDPQYSDFAYLSITMGMTYQVSDPAITATRFRKIALPHALLTYLFGTVFLASVLNILTSLGST